MIRAFTLSLFCLAVAFSLRAEKLVWEGSVQSDGTPTEAIPLELTKKYRFKVSGFTNLGKWVQNREKLANDANYEFNSEGAVEKLVSFRNSLDVPVGDGKYHSDHIYLSEPFTAKQNRVHFWMYDTDYDDNHGELKVELLHIADEKSIVAE